jgi:hypothetical protein
MRGEAAEGEPLSLLELRRIAPPEECERFTGVSWPTLKRAHPDKVRRISERRFGMRVGDLLEIGGDN